MRFCFAMRFKPHSSDMRVISEAFSHIRNLLLQQLRIRSASPFNRAFQGPSTGLFQGPATGHFQDPSTRLFQGPCTGHFQSPSTGHFQSSIDQHNQVTLSLHFLFRHHAFFDTQAVKLLVQ